MGTKNRVGRKTNLTKQDFDYIEGEKNMKNFQAVRISRNGRPTYGDRYDRLCGDFSINEIVSVGNDRYIIIFEEEA